METNDDPAIGIIERGETLAEQAYTRLRAALAGGVFEPGETLSIRRLARLLGVSATPARDAISRALWDRSLESGPNRTVLIPKLTVETVDQIYAVRINLEGLATEMAAHFIDQTQIDELEAIHAVYREAVEAGLLHEALQANENFHFFVYERSRNPLLVDMIQSLWLKMGPSLNFLFPAYFDRRGLNHKVKIIAALRRQSAFDARAALEADLIDGRSQVRLALERQAAETAAPEA